MLGQLVKSTAEKKRVSFTLCDPVKPADSSISYGSISRLTKEEYSADLRRNLRKNKQSPLAKPVCVRTVAYIGGLGQQSLAVSLNATCHVLIA